MIRHCVFVKFREDVSLADKAAVYKKLDDLRNVIPGIRDASFGANVSPEGMMQGFKDGFVMDFDDVAARDFYLQHPDHREAGSNMVGYVEGGREGVLVFDIEI